MTIKKLFVVASGSGGHIVPGLVLAQQWHKQHSNGQVWFFTGKKKLDQQLLLEAPGIFRTIFFGLKTFSLKSWWNIPLLVGQIIYAFFKSLCFVIKEQPEKIVTTGGLVGLPLCLAGRICGVTIEVYELNAVPGKAVKALLPIAHTIHTPFAMTAKHCSLLGVNFAEKCVFAPYPLRSFEPIRREDVFADINEKINDFSFSSERKTLLVIGGSQGSAFLNRTILQVLDKIVGETPQVQVIHQAGSKDSGRCRAWYKEHNIPALVFDFDLAMSDYFLIADLVVSRAGAGTLFELVHFKKRSIIIPLMTSTTTHQKDNAYAIAEQYPDLFTVVEQDHSTQKLAASIDQLRA